MTRSLQTTAVLVLALIMCGCGSAATKTASESAASSSGTDTIAAAEAICARTNHELAANAPARLTDASLARVTGLNSALERTTVEELAKLAPPASKEDLWKQMLHYRRLLASELERVEAYARDGNSAGISSLTAQKAKARRELLQAARGAGLGNCSRVG